MAAIITVHGTFATGPEEGDSWWQKGSDFQRDVREWVEAEDGQPTFQPHIWTGLNSEMARRAAANSLLQRLSKLDAQGQQYCLVGHSHGGSVIATAIVRRRRQRLAGLSRWITVGTPFITTEGRGLLFSRLGNFSKIAYLAFFNFGFLMSASYLYSYVYSSFPMQLALANSFMDFLPFVLLHGVLWLLDRSRSGAYSAFGRRAGAKLHVPQWVPLRHVNDEAIGGLGAISKISFPIFNRSFMEVPLLSAGVLISPLIIIGILLGGGTYFFSLFPKELIGDVSNLRSLFAAVEIIRSLSMVWVFPLVATGVISMQTASILGYFTGLLIIPLLFFLIAAILLVLIRVFSVIISAASGRALNEITWTQVRQSAFGNDTIGEVARGAFDRPSWVETSLLPLPSDLSREIADLSDRAAAQSIAKLRSAVQLLAFSGGDKKKSDLLAEYLTWDELIHTAYFKVPRFRKLVCYGIAHSQGFRPSEKFKSDPDYALLGAWYAQLNKNRAT